MATTQPELALQMVAQLRLLDPSVSAEVGTPERKILDTVAQNLFENQVDLTALTAALDIDSKYGTDLDRFFTIFGFNRQKATYSTGYVTFSRITASNVDIRIPSGARVQAPAVLQGDTDVLNIEFATVFESTIPAGSLSVVTPIRAVVAGSLGNVAANRITEVVGSPIFGITSLTNEVPTQNGVDSESDAEFKVRFKNTVFRNLAGTRDQFTALAISTAFTSRANVIGPLSNYREYIQVPPVDDSTAYDVNGDAVTEAGGGAAGEYTTALSTIPYAKRIYGVEQPSFISNGEVGIGSIFYRQDFDYRINTGDTARDAGDTHRLASVGLDEAPVDAPNRPNITFQNIYSGANADVQAVRPGDVLLLEYAYLSEVSRNDYENHITNAVDVFIDGGNDTQASTVIGRPTVISTFVDDPASKYHYENYRRIGEPSVRPMIGNVLTPLFWQPTTSVPEQIQVGTNTYYRGEHYWGVTDTSELSGTVRARSGIEWSTDLKGKADVDPTGDITLYTGKIITDASGDVAGTAIEVDDYTYDKNIVDLQAALEGSRQITTDVLAHKSRDRYFKLDVTVMYTPGVSVVDTNNQVHDAVDNFLRSQYFGTTIQLSDLLQAIHDVPGIDNVRWTSDTPNNPDLTRVYETDANGNPLLGAYIVRRHLGNATSGQVDHLFISGQPTSGSFILNWNNGAQVSEFDYNLTAPDLFANYWDTVTVVEDTRTTTGVRNPLRSFRITYTDLGVMPLPVVEQSATPLSGGPFIFNTDFFLRDDEQARLATGVHTPTNGVPDTVAGLIIRPRAQNTWVRSQ